MHWIIKSDAHCPSVTVQLNYSPSKSACTHINPCVVMCCCSLNLRTKRQMVEQTFWRGYSGSWSSRVRHEDSSQHLRAKHGQTHTSTPPEFCPWRAEAARKGVCAPAHLSQAANRHHLRTACFYSYRAFLTALISELIMELSVLVWMKLNVAPIVLGKPRLGWITFSQSWLSISAFWFSPLQAVRDYSQSLHPVKHAY